MDMMDLLKEMDPLKSKRRAWSRDETIELMRAFARRREEFATAKKKKPIMQKILRELQSQGVLTRTTTADMLLNKYKNMHKAYKMASEEDKETGVTHSEVELEALTDEVFGTPREKPKQSNFNQGLRPPKAVKRKPERDFLDVAEQIISLVKHHPILFDPSHEDHTNEEVKDEIWSEIAAKVNVTTDSVKRKWKNLTDTYLRFVKDKSAKTAKALYWTSLMDSFDPPLYVDSKPTVTSEYNDESDASDNDMEKSCSSIIECDEDQSDISEHEQEHTPTHEPVVRKPAMPTMKESRSIDVQPIDYLKIVQPPLPAKKTVKNVSRVSTSLESLVKLMKTNQQPELDEMDMLFLAHARLIKTFSRKRQAVAKMKVSQVLMEMELEDIDEKVSSDTNEKQTRTQSTEINSFQNKFSGDVNSTVPEQYIQTDDDGDVGMDCLF